MASIDLVIAGRRHELACRDGEEAHLRRIAALVDAKAIDAARSMSGMSEARQMLFTALMLADELDEARVSLARQAEAPPAPPPPPQPDSAPDAAIAAMIEQLADRIERLTATIDTPAPDGVEDGLETKAASA